MPTLLERVASAKVKRDKAEAEFRSSLVAARPTHSWQELGNVAGLSKNGVKYLVLEHLKGELADGGSPDEEHDRGDARARSRRDSAATRAPAKTPAVKP